MKLLSAKQIKEWDQYTITFEPISSIDLMERASLSFTRWFVEKFPDTRHPVSIFCGNGNNGGDGLAIARLLRNKLYDVEVFILKLSEKDSPDFLINLKRLQDLRDISIQYCEEKLPDIVPKSIIIDALLGTGTQREAKGRLAEIIKYFNKLENTIVAVDLPSGLPADGLFLGPTVIADFIFTFQIPKLSFFYKENDTFCKKWIVGDIGLDHSYYELCPAAHNLIDINLVSKILKKRPKHGHKGTFGHAAIIAGSVGMMGAAVLSTLACLRSGVGLVTAFVPNEGIPIIQNSISEALTTNIDNIDLNSSKIFEKCSSIGLGPGLSTSSHVVDRIKKILQNSNLPLVIDADALNIISNTHDLKRKIPQNSIITPHPKELTRWVGECNNEIEMFSKAKDVAVNLGIIVVLKGAYTRIFLPDGSQYINSTGNNGMATAGSGDVLTGIITGLLAQGYEPHLSALLGVFLHGLAGDLALKNQSEESLIARDIVDHLGAAFTKIKEYTPAF